MSYSEGEEGWDGLAELPHDVSHSGLGSAERNVRRRSSKACDQCRKSKCKCERSNPNEPCKNCIAMGTSCTFLGPSRKRGPPKGYIDAIEARLHQTEALLGIMLATTDSRAKSLLDDIAQDPLAKGIISRVDNSHYGVKGRRGEDVASVSKAGSTSDQGTESGYLNQDPAPDLRTTHPSNEWQDRVVNMINNLAPSLSQTHPSQDYNSPKSEVSEGNISQTSRRQRRRVGGEDYPLRTTVDVSKSASDSPASLRESHSGTTSWYHTPSPAWGDVSKSTFKFPASGSAGKTDRSSSIDSEALESNSEEDLLSAVGQLSINEDEQIRYHGKASGIYLLRKKERVDQRNEGGIWRFPKARVWPPLPSSSLSLNNADFGVDLPSKDVQEHLLNLYFTYVHPYLPIIHKQSFLEAFRDGTKEHMETTADHIDPTPNSRRRDIPVLLLLAMFACAARHDPVATPLPSDPSMMWPAGDEYLERAKVVLNSTYASSRPATVQALLLMAYREGGIGDMSLAWTYLGMAIRMAQDLGMHRCADGWKRSGRGRLFNEWELAERKRIWYGCVVLEKFISAFIGRPLMIFESDFDTILPGVDDLEENEEWSVEMALGEQSSPAPGRVLSCFNALAVLCIFGRVVQSLYAVQPAGDQQTDAAILESALDRWYLDLPEHLRYEVNAGSSFFGSLASKQKKPLPNVLGLHMYYWTTVLILHRPLIAHLLHRKEKHTDDEDPDWSRISRSYELCRTAAIHVASLTSLYQETYLFQRCPPHLIYCLFSSSILLDGDMARHPGDPQARFSFSKCVNGLNSMGVVWHSAARALALFTGAKTELEESSMVELTQSSTKVKRAAEEDLDDTSASGALHNTVGQLLPFAPKPRMGVPAMSNLQRRYSRPQMQQNRSSAFDVFSGGQGFMAPPIPNPSSPLLPELGNSSFIQDPNPFAQLSTAVIPHLYSSGFLDDVEGPVHGMQSLQSPQELQFYRAGTYPPPLVSHLGHYDLQEAVPPQFSLHSQHPHQSHLHPQQHPRMGQIRQTPLQQQHSDAYLPQRFNVYM